MADSKEADPADKTKGAPTVQYIQPESIVPPDQQRPQIITQIIKEPSFTHNLSVEVRNWVKARAKAFRSNLIADVIFCRAAATATLAERQRSEVVSVVTHTHKWLNWFFGLGIPAGVISLYTWLIYPRVGGKWTAIVVLCFVALCLLVTIRMTRRLYDRTAISFSESQSLSAALGGKVEALESELASTAERLTALEKRFEPYFSIRFVPFHYPFMQHFKRREITQYRVCVKSPVALRDAELVANRVRIHDTQYNDVHLRPMHDRVEGGTKRVKLTPFKEAAWDVVSEHSPGGVTLDCISALGLMVFNDGDHEFELMVTGGNSVPATKIVKLVIQDRQIISFELHEGRLTELII